MDISGRIVLIVGGTSGIGLGLARRFARAGSKVIVGGRNVACVTDLETVRIDVTDPDSVIRARDEVLEGHPGLDVVVTMSGVMIPEDLRDPAHFPLAETTIAVNLLGTIRVIDAFTPHLLSRGDGDIVTVTSGIAHLPFPLMPTYGASKAGVHAYTEALRPQLSGAGVRVTELVPPAVATEAQGGMNPAALPLSDYRRSSPADHSAERAESAERAHRRSGAAAALGRARRNLRRPPLAAIRSTQNAPRALMLRTTTEMAQ